MSLRVVGAGLGRTGTAFAEDRAASSCSAGPATTWARPSAAPTTSRCGTPRSNGEQPDWSVFLADYVATVDWPACAFWRELADGEPRRDRAAVDPVERGRVVEERERHHLPGLAAGDPAGRRPDVVPRAAGDGERHVRQHLHRRLARRDRGEARLRGAQRGGARRRRSRRGSSTGSRATAGSRSARALSLPVPDDTFPHVEHHRRLPGDDRPRRPSLDRAVRRGGGARPASAARPGRAGCRAGATRPAWRRHRSTPRGRSRRCRWRR